MVGIASLGEEIAAGAVVAGPVAAGAAGIRDAGMPPEDTAVVAAVVADTAGTGGTLEMLTER